MMGNVFLSKLFALAAQGQTFRHSVTPAVAVHVSCQPCFFTHPEPQTAVHRAPCLSTRSAQHRDCTAQRRSARLSSPARTGGSGSKEAVDCGSKRKTPVFFGVLAKHPFQNLPLRKKLVSHFDWRLFASDQHLPSSHSMTIHPPHAVRALRMWPHEKTSRNADF